MPPRAPSRGSSARPRRWHTTSASSTSPSGRAQAAATKPPRNASPAPVVSTHVDRERGRPDLDAAAARQAAFLPERHAHERRAELAPIASSARPGVRSRSARRGNCFRGDDRVDVREQFVNAGPHLLDVDDRRHAGLAGEAGRSCRGRGLVAVDDQHAAGRRSPSRVDRRPESIVSPACRCHSTVRSPVLSSTRTTANWLVAPCNGSTPPRRPRLFVRLVRAARQVVVAEAADIAGAPSEPRADADGGRRSGRRAAARTVRAAAWSCAPEIRTRRATRSMLLRPRPTTSNAGSARKVSGETEGARADASSGPVVSTIARAQAVLRFAPSRRSSSILSYGEPLKGLNGVRSQVVLRPDSGHPCARGGRPVLGSGVRAAAHAGAPRRDAHHRRRARLPARQVQPRFYDYPWLYMWVLTGSVSSATTCGAWSPAAFHSLAELVASWPDHWAAVLPDHPRALGRGRHRDGRRGLPAGAKAVGRADGPGRRALPGARVHARARLAFRHHRRDDDAAHRLVGRLLVSAHPSGEAVASSCSPDSSAGLPPRPSTTALLLVAPIVASQLLHARASPGVVLAALLDRAPPVVRSAVCSARFAIGVPFVFIDAADFSGRDAATWRTRCGIGQGSMNPDNGWVHHLTYSLRYGLGLPLLVAGLAARSRWLFATPRRAAAAVGLSARVLRGRRQLRESVLPLHDSDRAVPLPRGGLSGDGGGPPR